MRVEEVEGLDFPLRLIEAESFEEVPEAQKDSYYRVEIPSNPANIIAMEKKGYLFVERTIGVAINLKNSVDYQKMIRFDIRRETVPNEAVLNIALDSFPSDRRFHVRAVPDASVAAPIITDWVKNLTDIYVCLHKDQIVGFLDLEPYGKNDLFIHLAAVQERYRAAGAAVSLYAYAVQQAKERCADRLCGRISSMNTAVMNLYARLGGTFAEPRDVFVRNEV